MVALGHGVSRGVSMHGHCKLIKSIVTRVLVVRLTTNLLQGPRLFSFPLLISSCTSRFANAIALGDIDDDNDPLGFGRSFLRLK